MRKLILLSSVVFLLAVGCGSVSDGPGYSGGRWGCHNALDLSYDVYDGLLTSQEVFDKSRGIHEDLQYAHPQIAESAKKVRRASVQRDMTEWLIAMSELLNLCRAANYYD